MAPPPSTHLPSSNSQYLRQLTEDYFLGTSPLCRRLMEDMGAARSAWGTEWDQLTYDQQCRILDQAVVDQEIMRHYQSSMPMCPPGHQYYPKLQLASGQKVVCDESLSARGYTCSWRDEHSAPFSWHTRSQMDLTLDTPPMTPPNIASPSEDTRVLTGPKSIYKSRPLSMSVNKPPGFIWHYDPVEYIPPDPPDLVLAATAKTEALPAPGAHLVVRADEDQKGFINRLRGAFIKLSTACFPLHAARGTQPTHTLHHTQLPPELRPAHVLAQGKKKNSITSQKSYASKLSRPSVDSSITPKNCHSSLNSLYGYYDLNKSETFNQDNVDSAYKSDKLSESSKGYGSLNKNCSNQSRTSFDVSQTSFDVSTCPTETITTSQSMVSNSSRTLSHYQDSPTITLRSSSQSIYKTDNNSRENLENNNAIANVQQNLKAHFRIMDRPQIDDSPYKSRREITSLDPQQMSKLDEELNLIHERQSRSSFKIEKNANHMEKIEEISPKVLDTKLKINNDEGKGSKNKETDEEKKHLLHEESDVETPRTTLFKSEPSAYASLSASQTSIPKTGFDFLDNW